MIRNKPACGGVREGQQGVCREGDFAVELGENLVDHDRVFDAGDDPQSPAAGRTGLDVDAKRRP